MQTTTVRPSRLILACSIASMIALTPAAFADVQWNGNVDNDFNNAANWTGGSPVGQNAYIGIAGGGNPAFTATITANTGQMADFQIARGGGPGVVNHSAGIAQTGNDQWMDVGTAGGNGTYNLGLVGGAPGALTGIGLGSGGVQVGGGNGGNGRLYVGGVDFSGGGGTGLFRVNTTGTLQIDNDLIIGTGNGTGVMNVDAGTITTGGWNFIGKADNGPGNGRLNMGGGTLTNTGRTYVGTGGGAGKIELTGTGTYSNSNNELFVVGDGGGSNGTLNVLSSTALLNAGGELWVGQGGGTGTMTISAGTVQANNWLAIGRDNGTGVVNLSGTGVLKKTGGSGNHLIIGSLGGNGNVFQTGGQMLTQGGGDILLGENSNSGTWTISAGVASADNVKLGAIGAGSGFVNLSGTGAITTGLMNIAASGPGTLTQTGGTLTVTDVDVQGSGATGIYNLSGGVLSMDGAMSLDNGSFGFSGGKITRSNAGVITFNGALTAGSNAATLKLDTNKTFDVNGAFNITTGITFEVNGMTIPASLPGVLQTGSFTLGTDDSIVGLFTPATTSLPGLIDLSGATFISEAAGEGGGFDPGVDRVYWVEEDAGVVSLQYSVPEPTTFGLLALAGLGLASRRRRK